MAQTTQTTAAGWGKAQLTGQSGGEGTDTKKSSPHTRNVAQTPAALSSPSTRTEDPPHPPTTACRRGHQHPPRSSNDGTSVTGKPHPHKSHTKLRARILHPTAPTGESPHHVQTVTTAPTRHLSPRGGCPPRSHLPSAPFAHARNRSLTRRRTAPSATVAKTHTPTVLPATHEPLSRSTRLTSFTTAGGPSPQPPPPGSPRLAASPQPSQAPPSAGPTSQSRPPRPPAPSPAGCVPSH